MGAFAQSESYDIDSTLSFGVVSYDNKLVVRWTPMNKEIYDKAKNGYTLTVSWKEDEIDRLLTEVIFPSPKNEWSKSTNQDYGFKVAKAINDADLQREMEPYSMIDRAKITLNTYGFQMVMADISTEAAIHMGLAYIVDEPIENTRYTFTLSSNELADRKRIVRINSSKIQTPPQIDKLAAIGGDLKATLQWDFIQFTKWYAVYYIEKSIDGGQSYQKINDVPFLPMTSAINDVPADVIEYSDSLLENGKSYFYRIYGITHFGQKGPYSNLVEVVGVHDPIPAVPFITDVFDNDGNTFDISWFFDETFQDEVQTFQVWKSMDGRKSYQVVAENLKPSQRNWVDRKPETVAHYKVVVRDVNGNTVESLAALAQQEDNEPPLAPIGLQGKIDSTGQVSLWWKANDELDLQGYYVFYSNSRNAEYSILTRTKISRDTFFADSLYTNTLSEKIYYKLMALDFRGNQSDFSEPIKLKRPDLHPPSPAVFKKREQRVDAIYFTYSTSSSQDLITNIVQRRSITSQWEEVAQNSLRNTTLSFVDTTVNCKEIFEYRIKSVDDDKLFSYSDTIRMKCIDSGKRDAISNFRVFTEDNFHTLQWSNSSSQSVRSIIIYKSANDDPMRKIKQFFKSEVTDLPAYEYKDRDIKDNTSYKYRVVMRYEDNGFAKSDVVEIEKAK